MTLIYQDKRALSLLVQWVQIYRLIGIVRNLLRSNSDSYKRCEKKRNAERNFSHSVPPVTWVRKEVTARVADDTRSVALR